MDEEKKSGSSRVETFFAGKGFYIVLLLCVAVIGVSAWSLLSGGGGRTEDLGELPISVAGIDEEPDVVTGKTAPVVVTEAPVSRVETTAAPAIAEVVSTEVEQAAEAAVAIPEETVPVEAGRDYFIWPVSGTVENDYAMTSLTFDRTMQDWRTHDGVDIGADLGSHVRAAANGKVTDIYYDERLGTTVVMSHNGGLETIYANLAATPTVSVGDQVGVGQVIGAVGDSALYEVGEVSHLHFAMTLDGESVDPNAYLP